METLKGGGAELISFLQQTPLASQALPLHRLVYYATPGFVLTVLCPVLLALQGAPLGKTGVTVSSAVALQVIWTAVVSLRLNTFRQWSLGEDRPYWWVMETTRYSKSKVPYLQQYPNTCLGSPSAPTFSVIEAGVGLVLTCSLLQLVNQINFSEEKHRRWARAAVWLTYLSLLFLVCVSDMFFAAHFPHQVLVSVVIGVAVALFMIRQDFSRQGSFWRTLAINSLLMAISLATMYKGEAVGSFNTYQKLSFRWCQRREWMQIDPTPLLDLFVFTGTALGIAAATTMRFYKKLNKAKFSLKMLVSLVVLNIVVSQAILVVVDLVPASTLQPWVYAWYGGQMLGSALVPLFSAALVPYFVQAASGLQPMVTKQKKT